MWLYLFILPVHFITWCTLFGLFFIKDICVTKKIDYTTVIHKFNIIEMNYATLECLQQNIHMVSYDHHGFYSKNNYILANSNYGGFQESELSNLILLNMSWPLYPFVTNPPPTTQITFSLNTLCTIWQKSDGSFIQQFNILINSAQTPSYNKEIKKSPQSIQKVGQGILDTF